MHAKGGGAHGFFETTEDVSQYTKAVPFQKGKRTELFIRFSTVAGERGYADTSRDPRGFAIKFYTEQGNYDMVGNNTPVFFVHDPQKFQDFIHSQKRRADNHLRDNNMQWDFWTLSPESAHMVTWLMGDRGLPRSWRHMNGYSSHTYMWVNGGGERVWVKYHFKADLGVQHLTQAEGTELAGQNPDYHLQDLYQAIKSGDHPSWTLYMQVMPFQDAADYRFNPFDLTKVWPHGDYPLVKVGRMVLDRNPENYFAEVEQAAFEPNNLIPGIGPSPRQDALGPALQLPRHPPAPDRLQRHAVACQRPRAARSTRTTGTERCATTTRPTRFMLPTRWEGRWPPPSCSVRTRRGRSPARCCVRPTRCTKRMTISARPAPWSTRRWTRAAGTGSSPTWWATSRLACKSPSSPGLWTTGAISTRRSGSASPKGCRAESSTAGPAWRPADLLGHLLEEVGVRPAL